MTSDSRAQRLVDEFEETASSYEGYSVRHGIAAALRAAADGCDPDWLALTVLHHLHSIADELEAQ